MARAYNARLVALTIGVPDKWLDNLLSHHDLPGVTRSRQGVERRISDEGLLAIELCRILAKELGIPVTQAAVIVRSSLPRRESAELRFTTASGVQLLLPVASIEHRLRERTLEAVEAVARIPRGRPRRSTL